MPSLTVSSAPGADTAHPRRWAAAAVLMTAALMDLVDVTIVNVALPSLGQGLGASDSALQWTVSAYLLGFAATLVVAGRLGDRYGRRPLFLAGTAAFGLASLACGLAQTPGQLIAARAVQGVAAAVLMPQVLGSFHSLFRGRERGKVFGMYGAVAGFASALGLLLGGILTDADLFGLGWRTVFLVNVPVAALTLAAAVVLVPSTRERSTTRPPVLGSLVLAAGLVAVVLPLVQGGEWGWPLWGWGLLAAGVLAVTGVAARGAVIPRRLFTVPAFSLGLAVQLLFALGMQGFFLVLALWLQGGQGYTPTQAGVLMVAFSAGGFLTAPAAEPLAVKLGRYVPAAGAVLMGAGYGWVWYAMEHASPHATAAWPLVPGLVVAGAGLGLLVVPLVNIVLSAAPAALAGGASGVFSTAQQFGGALGAAVVGTAYFADLSLAAALPWVLGAYALTALLSLGLPRTAVPETP
ncbi:MFS transporter [Streptomyces sp. NRRL F-5727]|uniref:MFS transporter n=1 Tax=Streptomyces sp. NRRL F-5727 TaxID=1463871 RepID=UPI0004C8A50F|nr:MFS transporter [Streptomyces sp. NRRL F-5727]